MIERQIENNKSHSWTLTPSRLSNLLPQKAASYRTACLASANDGDWPCVALCGVLLLWFGHVSCERLTVFYLLPSSLQHRSVE